MNKILFVITGSIAASKCKDIMASLNLNKYQIVSVECEGGLNDSGYSIPIRQKVYLKELSKEGIVGIICQNKK